MTTCSCGMLACIAALHVCKHLCSSSELFQNVGVSDERQLGQTVLIGDNHNAGHVESWTHPPAAHAVKQDYPVNLPNRFNRGTTAQPQNMNLMKHRAVKSLGRLAHGMSSTATVHLHLTMQGV